MNRELRKERVCQQLGMPQGTAQHRLRKMILFYLLKRLNENVCFKCGEEIQTVDVLSIEHKHPWENRDARLFWDMENIAFSHIHCNRPDQRGFGPTPRMIMPDGMSWCARHKQFFPIEKFSSNKSTNHGLCWYCKDCQHLTGSNPTDV